MVYTTGEMVTYPTVSGIGLSLILSGKGPFGKEGVVVGYKNGSASFLKGIDHDGAVQVPGFISKSYGDSGTYTQIRP